MFNCNPAFFILDKAQSPYPIPDQLLIVHENKISNKLVRNMNLPKGFDDSLAICVYLNSYSQEIPVKCIIT